MNSLCNAFVKIEVKECNYTRFGRKLRPAIFFQSATKREELEDESTSEEDDEEDGNCSIYTESEVDLEETLSDQEFINDEPEEEIKIEEIPEEIIESDKEDTESESEMEIDLYSEDSNF
jgi:hypothetical protein